MTETEKRHAGEMYYAMDPDIRRDYLESRSVCWRYNQLAPWQEAEREALLKGFLHQTGEHLTIEPPFYCDFGFNVEVGENFFANYNLTILSGAKVKFGDNVFLGPNCGFYPPEHPHDSLANLASSAYLLGEARPWITGDSSSPRRAAVLGANFDATDPVGAAAKGGRSAVIVLEEEPEVRS